MADLTQVAQSASSMIGRYFSVVSLLPSIVLVAWVFVVTASGAWSGRPEVRAMVEATTTLSVGAVVALTFAAVALGTVLHPLQYAFVQILEGYWGVSGVAQRCRGTRILHHRRRLVALREAEYAALDQLDARPPGSAGPGHEEAWVRQQSYADESRRLASSMPETLDETMPTRLGNVLRFYERRAGAPYNLEAIQAMPFVAQVAAPADMAYVDDQRSQLDLAVRTIVVSLLAFVLTALPLLTDGLWLLVALVPYGAAYLSYRGAVVAAAEYGRALGVVIALNRFALYERLRVPQPSTTLAERAANVVVTNMLAYGSGQHVNIVYADRPPAPSTEPGDAGGR